MRKEEGHVTTFQNIDTNLSLTIASILLVVFVGFSWLIFHPSSFL
jgi:hypothetical protein